MSKIVEIIESIDNFAEEVISAVTDKMVEKTNSLDKAKEKVQFLNNISNVERWGDEKGITNPLNAKSQLLKTVEELGELAADIAKERDPRDSMGDVLVTLILTAKCLGITLEESLDLAWNTIKDRKGKTVDGVFVKEED